MTIKRFWIIAIVFISLISCNNENKTYIIAHRGYSAIAPENTMSSFKEAVKIGADYIELDVHKTKDGKIVVIHDSSIDKTSSTNDKGEIDQINYSDLQKMHVGFSSKFGDKFKYEKLPTLEEVLKFSKDKVKVCIELKYDDIEKDVVKLIEETGMTNEVIVFDFDFNAVEKVENLNHDIETLFLQGYSTLQTIDSIKAAGLNAIGVNQKKTTVDKNFMEYAHKNNIKVYSYVVDDEKRMKELIGVKIDGIITNRPDLALKHN